MYQKIHRWVDEEEIDTSEERESPPERDESGDAEPVYYRRRWGESEDE